MHTSSRHLIVIICCLLAATSLAKAQSVDPQKAQGDQCLLQAKQIALACKLYASDHDGRYPDTLEALLPNYITDKKILICPFCGGKAPIGYECLGGTDTEPSNTILLRSKFATRDGRKTIVYSDCSAELKVP